VDKQLARDIVWLETWVAEHSSSRAAERVARLLVAYKKLAEAQDDQEHPS
jgi:hypothetical protein